MSKYNSHPHNSSGNTLESPKNNDEVPTHLADFTPQTHAVNIFFQLRDDNGLYNASADLQQQLRGENGYDGHSDHPHYVGDMSPSWTPGEGEHYVGFYSSSTGIGYLNEEGEFVGYDDQWLRLFENIDEGEDATLPAKCTVTLEPRGPTLVNEEMESFGYPKAFDGERYTGTYIKAKVSYAQSFNEAVEWVAEYFQHLDDEFGTSFMSYWEPIPETFYFSGLERYVRHNIESMHRILHTERNTSRLIHTGNEGEEGTSKEDIRHGQYSLFSVSSTEFEQLGYTAGPRRDGKLAVKKDKIKTYRAENASRYSEKNYRHHPKTETKATKGTFHTSVWERVIDRLDSILLHHLEMSSIDEDDLVSDDYFQPLDEDGEPLDDSTFQKREYQAPTGRMADLRASWEGEDTRRKLEGFIHHSTTDAYKDILNILMFDPEHGGRSVTYKYLERKTGLSYSSVQRNVTKLTDARILHKETGACTFVKWASQIAFERVRDWLGNYFDPKKVLDGIVSRAKARILDREDDRDDANGADEEDEEVDNKPEDDEIPDVNDISGHGMLSKEAQEELRDIREQMENGVLPGFNVARDILDRGID